LTKTKVVEEEEIYKFDVGQKLIGALDLAENQEQELNYT